MDDKMIAIIDKLNGISGTAFNEALRWIHIKTTIAFWVAIACYLVFIVTLAFGIREYKKDGTGLGMIFSVFFFIMGLTMTYQYFAYKIAPSVSAIRYLIDG